MTKKQLRTTRENTIITYSLIIRLSMDEYYSFYFCHIGNQCLQIFCLMCVYPFILFEIGSNLHTKLLGRLTWMNWKMYRTMNQVLNIPYSGYWNVPPDGDHTHFEFASLAWYSDLCVCVPRTYMTQCSGKYGKQPQNREHAVGRAYV